MPLTGHAGLRRSPRASREEASRCAVAEPPRLSPACPHREHRSAAATFLFPTGPRARIPVGTVSRVPRGGSLAAGVPGSQLVPLSPWQQRA